MALEAFEKLPDEKKEKILSVGIQEFSQKSYREVSTDIITGKCEISKGLLFHYFGSKKNYYLYCLNKAMESLTGMNQDIEGKDFYDVLFSSMNQKMLTCIEYKDEMHMVNMATRDPAVEIAFEKEEILRGYMSEIQKESVRTLEKAISFLSLKNQNTKETALSGLHIYINALLNTYLLKYQEKPDLFFERSSRIKEEIKEYLDLMLYGICEEES